MDTVGVVLNYCCLLIDLIPYLITSLMWTCRCSTSTHTLTWTTTSSTTSNHGVVPRRKRYTGRGYLRKQSTKPVCNIRNLLVSCVHAKTVLKEKHSLHELRCRSHSKTVRLYIKNSMSFWNYHAHCFITVTLMVMVDVVFPKLSSHRKSIIRMLTLHSWRWWTT